MGISCMTKVVYSIKCKQNKRAECQIYSAWPTVTKSSCRNVKYRIKISPTATQADLQEWIYMQMTGTSMRHIENGWEGGKEENWTILDIHHCPPSSSILPLSSLPVLSSTSGAVFPPSSGSSLGLSLFFRPSLFPCVSSCGVGVAWTPPLTDNSLDGPLLRTAQCTAILPQWAPDLWWTEMITPSTLSGTSQTEKGGEWWVKLFLTGWTVPWKCMGNLGNLEYFSLWQDKGWCIIVVCGLKYHVYVEIWPHEGHIFKQPCVFMIPSSPLLPWGLLQSCVVVYITLTWGYCAFPFKIRCIVRVNGMQKCFCWKIQLAEFLPLDQKVQGRDLCCNCVNIEKTMHRKQVFLYAFN